MLDAKKIILEINPPPRVAAVILRALSSEPTRDRAVALCSLARFYTIFEHTAEADAVYQAAIHVASAAAGPEDQLVDDIRKDVETLRVLIQEGKAGAICVTPSTTDKRSILRGPDRVFLTHEPPQEVADTIFDALEAEPTAEAARSLRDLARSNFIPAEKLEEAEALLLCALEVTNNAGCDEALMGEIYADFDAVVELMKRNVKDHSVEEIPWEKKSKQFS